MKIKLFIILILILPANLSGQGDIDNSEKIFYRNERTFGFLLNSNGIGTNFRYAKRIDAFRKTLYELELNYVKHPKEIRISSDINRNYIFGKKNSVVTLKAATGYQKELFQKRDRGGISIRYFINGGISAAILKPVYYEYYDIFNDEFSFKKFDKHQYENIVGRAPFTKGFDEIKVSPGLFGKVGFCFEYSRVDEVFKALEAGVGLDAYAIKVPIMDVPQERILFILPDNYFILTLFLSYRFGKVIDMKRNPGRSKIDKLIID